MNKTQMLSATENLLYCKGKNTIYNFEQKWLLDTAISLVQLTPEMENTGVFSMLHFWRQLHNKYTTAP